MIMNTDLKDPEISLIDCAILNQFQRMYATQTISPRTAQTQSRIRAFIRTPRSSPRTPEPADLQEQIYVIFGKFVKKSPSIAESESGIPTLRPGSRISFPVASIEKYRDITTAFINAVEKKQSSEKEQQSERDGAILAEAHRFNTVLTLIINWNAELNNLGNDIEHRIAARVKIEFRDLAKKRKLGEKELASLSLSDLLFLYREVPKFNDEEHMMGVFNALKPTKNILGEYSEMASQMPTWIRREEERNGAKLGKKCYSSEVEKIIRSLKKRLDPCKEKETKYLLSKIASKLNVMPISSISWSTPEKKIEPFYCYGTGRVQGRFDPFAELSTSYFSGMGYGVVDDGEGKVDKMEKEEKTDEENEITEGSSEEVEKTVLRDNQLICCLPNGIFLMAAARSEHGSLETHYSSKYILQTLKKTIERALKREKLQTPLSLMQNIIVTSHLKAKMKGLVCSLIFSLAIPTASGYSCMGAAFGNARGFLLSKRGKIYRDLNPSHMSTSRFEQSLFLGGDIEGADDNMFNFWCCTLSANTYIILGSEGLSHYLDACRMQKVSARCGK